MAMLCKLFQPPTYLKTWKSVVLSCNDGWWVVRAIQLIVFIYVSGSNNLCMTHNMRIQNHSGGKRTIANRNCRLKKFVGTHDDRPTRQTTFLAQRLRGNRDSWAYWPLRKDATCLQARAILYLIPASTRSPLNFFHWSLLLYTIQLWILLASY